MSNIDWNYNDCYNWKPIQASILWAIMRHWETPKRVNLWRCVIDNLFFVYINDTQKFRIDQQKFFDFLLVYCVKGSERWISKNPCKINWRKEGF